MEYLINTRSVKMNKLLTVILPSMIDQLGLTKSKKCLVVSLEKDCDRMGLTVDLDFGFMIVLKSTMKWNEICLALAHEMVHVRQMAKGIMKATEGGYLWAGKFYSKDTAYLDMPWELDAYAKQEIVLRRALL